MGERDGRHGEDRRRRGPLGISHVTFAVAELERSFRFYVDLLRARPLARWRRGAYLQVGTLWLCLCVDERARAGPLPEYTHLAFAVAPDVFPELCRHLAAAGAREWQQNRSEGESRYILDPDGHKLELHVGTLASRLSACRADPYEDMEFFD